MNAMVKDDDPENKIEIRMRTIGIAWLCQVLKKIEIGLRH